MNWLTKALNKYIKNRFTKEQLKTASEVRVDPSSPRDFSVGDRYVVPAGSDVRVNYDHATDAFTYTLNNNPGGQLDIGRLQAAAYRVEHMGMAAQLDGRFMEAGQLGARQQALVPDEYLRTLQNQLNEQMYYGTFYTGNAAPPRPRGVWGKPSKIKWARLESK